MVQSDVCQIVKFHLRNASLSIYVSESKYRTVEYDLIDESPFCDRNDSLNAAFMLVKALKLKFNNVPMITGYLIQHKMYLILALVLPLIGDRCIEGT
jgi:hypothetical protein